MSVLGLGAPYIDTFRIMSQQNNELKLFSNKEVVAMALIDDDSLLKALKEVGVTDVGPINDSTRDVYLRKVRQHQTKEE